MKVAAPNLKLMFVPGDNMYSEILNPSKKEQKANVICLVSAILLLLSTPYIYQFCLKMPAVLGECSMAILYALIILLFYRVYTHFICGYRYSIILEEQIKILPRNMGVISLKPGYIVIERMYGSKVATFVIISQEEIEEIAQYKDEKYNKILKNKKILFNRKLFTNRGRKNGYILIYKRNRKKYYCLITPSEEFKKKVNDFRIFS